MFKLAIQENVDKDVLKSFEMKDTLNPKFWNNLVLDPNVRIRLLEIAKDFFLSLELKDNVPLRDIRLTGSIANFNWSKFSDVDLHLIVDFEDIYHDNYAEEFVRPLVLAKKSEWNDAHDIKIFGFPVEVYVEDVNDKNITSGLFSILNNKWITIPNKQTIVIDKDDIEAKVRSFSGYLKYLLEKMVNKNYDSVISGVDKIKEKIKRMRQCGLERGGEFSTENLAFKVLRRSSYIDKLTRLRKQAFDKKMTLENLNET